MNKSMLYILIPFIATTLPNVYALDKSSEEFLNQPGMENFKGKILGEDQNMSSLADEIKSKVSEYIQNPQKAIEA